MDGPTHYVVKERFLYYPTNLQGTTPVLPLRSALRLTSNILVYFGFCRKKPNCFRLILAGGDSFLFLFFEKAGWIAYDGQ